MKFLAFAQMNIHTDCSLKVITVEMKNDFARGACYILEKLTVDVEKSYNYKDCVSYFLA